MLARLPSFSNVSHANVYTHETQCFILCLNDIYASAIVSLNVFYWQLASFKLPALSVEANTSIAQDYARI